MGWRRRAAHDRAVAQWRRELERLDEPGAPWADGPQVHPVGSPPPDPSSRRGRRPRRERRQRGPLLPGLAVVLGLLGFVLLSNPANTRYWAEELHRRVVGEPSTAYAFMATGLGGKPVTWDHCEPVRFLVNPDDAPPGWRDVVDDAVAEVREASGFDLVDAGTTAEIDYLGRPAGDPVLVGWGRASTYPVLRGGVAGLGGASTVVTGGRARFVTGQVLLDAGAYAEMDRLGEGDAMRRILVHEWLHVLGLDHVDDRHELMHPSYEGQDLGAGDRAGLARLRAVPCG